MSQSSYIGVDDLTLDFSDKASIKQFIQNADRWNGFEGKNTDGESVLVFVQQNEFLVTKTIHAKQPRWYEVVEYDIEGNQVSVEYEPTGDYEEQLNNKCD